MSIVRPLAAALIAIGFAAQAPGQSAAPVAMSPQAAARVAAAIARDIQPCANRQKKPGPGAERIRVTVHVRLNRDGSLDGEPEVTGYDGIDADNVRFLDRIKSNAVGTFKDCAPIRDLPPELYDVPHGWSDFKMRYKLPG